MPAWCTPMPLRTSFDRVLPNPAPNRNAPIRSEIASRSSRDSFGPPDLGESSDVACSIAAAWVKCTTYTGACLVATSSSRVSASGVIA